MNEIIAILGCGAGGMAMAADLTLLGKTVHLFELPEFNTYADEIIAAGGIERLGFPGSQHEKSGKRRVLPSLVTTDAAAALAGAQLILVSVPVFGHQRMVEAIAPHLVDGQAVLFNTGYWAALRFRDQLTDHGRRQVIPAESTLLAYAVRKTGPAAIFVDGIKQDFPVAALPATATGRLVDLIRPGYPQVRGMRSVIEVSLENLNPLFHPAITLLNIGELERTTGEFAFYRDGCTPAVGRIIDALDRERLAVGAALGYPDLISAPGWLQRYYGAQGDTAHAAIQSCPAYRDFTWAAKTAVRYVHEDVPYAFVPLVSIAEQIGLKVPVTRGLVDLCGTAFGRDYWAEGPKAADLGLQGLNAVEIRKKGENP